MSSYIPVNKDVGIVITSILTYVEQRKAVITVAGS